jgi:hypothetical protein
MDENLEGEETTRESELAPVSNEVVSETVESDGQVAEPQESPRAWGKLAAAGVVVVALVVGVIAITNSSSASAADLVRTALASTLKAPTVDITATMTETLSNEQLTFKGTGKVASNATAAVIDMTATGNSKLASELGTMTEEMVNGTLYLKYSGSAASDFPTPWLSVPFNLATVKGSAPTSSNPLGSLTLLASDGAQISDVGPAQFNGQSTEKYYVSVPASASKKLITQSEASLPSWMRSAIKSQKSLNASEVGYVYVAGGAVVATQLKITETISGATVTTTADIGYKQDWSPIDVTAPPSNQVTSLKSLL